MADALTILSGGDQLHLAAEADHIPVVRVEPTWKASVSHTGEFVRAQVLRAVVNPSMQRGLSL